MRSNREGRGFESLTPIHYHSREFNLPQKKSRRIEKLLIFIVFTYIMFYTYIIYSVTIDKYYVGATENLSERLKKHQNKNKGFTNQATDWEIVFTESFETKIEALAFVL